jgi:hypothetical protein
MTNEQPLASADYIAPGDLRAYGSPSFGTSNETSDEQRRSNVNTERAPSALS